MPDMTRRGFLGSLLVLGGAGLVPIKLNPAEKPIEKIKLTVDQVPGWKGKSIEVRPVKVAYMDGQGSVRWHKTRFSFLRDGDIFQFADIEGDGEVCIAVGDPFPVPIGENKEHWTWGVECDPYSVLDLTQEDEAHLRLVGEGLLNPNNMDSDRIGSDPFSARWRGHTPEELGLDDMEPPTYEEVW